VSITAVRLRAALLGAGLAWLAGALGCNTEPPPAPPPEFSGPVQQMAASASGQLRVDVRWSPQPPAVGNAAAELAIFDGTGAPVAGLSIAGLLWMPAHGHGASVQPELIEDEPGVFVAAPLYFFMPGAWELRLTMSGSRDDTATIALELP
jgi:hypothetical protein